MRYSTQIKPISYVKGHFAELLDRITDEREPIIITQNGEARAVLVDIYTFEQTQETINLLQILLIGEREIAEGKTRSVNEVIKSLRLKGLGTREPGIAATPVKDKPAK